MLRRKNSFQHFLCELLKNATAPGYTMIILVEEFLFKCFKSLKNNKTINAKKDSQKCILKVIRDFFRKKRDIITKKLLNSIEIDIAVL